VQIGKGGSSFPKTYTSEQGKASVRIFHGEMGAPETCPPLLYSGESGITLRPFSELFPLQRRAEWQVTHGTCNVPIRQSQAADALKDVHLVGDARPMQPIGQRFRTL
jgi:hypothetical protein